jgi:hypothetical protein
VSCRSFLSTSWFSMFFEGMNDLMIFGRPSLQARSLSGGGGSCRAVGALRAAHASASSRTRGAGHDRERGHS